jgi:hypothetical protein
LEANRIRSNLSCVREIGLGSTMIPAKKKESPKADFAFDPEGGRQEDVGEVQAFHLLLMLLRYMQIRSVPGAGPPEIYRDCPLLFSVAQGIF